MTSLEADVKFFQVHRIIDYSILISVVDMTKLSPNYLKTELLERNHHIFKCCEQPNICYFIGIIDYFQLYNLQKKSERFLKKTLKCRADTSAQPPKPYASRFLLKMQEYFVHDERGLSIQPQIMIQGMLGQSTDNYQKLNDSPNDASNNINEETYDNL